MAFANGNKPNEGIPSDANTLVGVWMLQPCESEIVARQLHAALTQKA
jgi:hypothetical protein